MWGKTPKPQKHYKAYAPQSFATKAHSELSEIPFSGGAGGSAEGGSAKGPSCARPRGCGREFHQESPHRGAVTASTWTQTPSPSLD